MKNFKIVKQINTRETYQKIAELEINIFIRDFDFALDSGEKVEEILKNCEIAFIYENEDVIGYTAVEKLSDSKYEIIGIAVLPDYQGKGIGSQAMQYIFEEYPNATFRLVTDPRNISAVNFYYKHGFLITDYLQDYYGEGFDRLELVRNIEKSA